MLKLRVYDKSELPANNLLGILSVIALVLIGSIFLLNTLNAGVSSYILYVLLPVALTIGVIRLIQTAHYYGPIGKTFSLTINEDSINFLDTKVSLSEVDRIIIRLPDKTIQYHYISNNYLKITTRYGKTYEFAILIDHIDHVIQIDKFTRSLKHKVSNLTYED